MTEEEFQALKRKYEAAQRVKAIEAEIKTSLDVLKHHQRRLDDAIAELEREEAKC